MSTARHLSVATAILLLGLGAVAPQARADDPEAWIEIFRLAPGKHEAFLRVVAKGDEVSKAAGLSPTQVYLHQDGGDWDVLLLKPVVLPEPTPQQEAAMAAKARELGVPSGPAYWVAIRELMASHTDTKATGPIVAAEWLARLDAWRAAHKAAAAPSAGP